MTYRSKPADCAPIGFTRMTLTGQPWADSDVFITTAPLVDTSTPEGLTASLACPTDAETALARWGCRLPTSAEFAALRKYGYRINPVELPSAEMRPPPIPGEDARTYAIRCYSRMQDRDWTAIADLRCFRQLATWDRIQPIYNFGKYPYRNGPNAPPPGRCYLVGWDDVQKAVPDGTPGPHADGQFDYGTKTMGALIDPARFFTKELSDQMMLARSKFLASIPEHA